MTKMKLMNDLNYLVVFDRLADLAIRASLITVPEKTLIAMKGTRKAVYDLRHLRNLIGTLRDRVAALSKEQVGNRALVREVVAVLNDLEVTYGIKGVE